jgi:nucleoid-associated protein YgaU
MVLAMVDPFATNSRDQLIREAQRGLTIVVMLFAILAYLAMDRFKGRNKDIPDHVLDAPVAQTVWPYSSDSPFAAQRRIDRQRERSPVEPLPSLGLSKQPLASAQVQPAPHDGSSSSPLSSAEKALVFNPDQPPNKLDNRFLDQDFSSAYHADKGRLNTGTSNVITPTIDADGLGKSADHSSFEEYQPKLISAASQSELDAEKKTGILIQIEPETESAGPYAHLASENSSSIANCVGDDAVEKLTSSAVFEQKQTTAKELGSPEPESDREDVESQFSVELVSDDRSNSTRLPTDSELRALAPCEAKPLNSLELFNPISDEPILIAPRVELSLSHSRMPTQTEMEPNFENSQSLASPHLIAEAAVSDEPITLPTRHTIVKGDSFYSIAQHYYGDGRFFRALYQFNSAHVSDFNRLREGSTLEIPCREELGIRLSNERQGQGSVRPVPTPAADMKSSSAAKRGDEPTDDRLREANSKLFRQSSIANPAQSPDPLQPPEHATGHLFHPTPTYLTQGGETLFEIAAKRLGQASRYLEILKLNQSRLRPDVNDSTPLPPNLLLIMPRDTR